MARSPFKAQSPKRGPLQGLRPSPQNFPADPTPFEGAWGLPVPRLTRPLRYTLTGRVRLGKPSLRQNRVYYRALLIKLAPSHRYVKGKVKLGKPTRGLFGRPPIRRPLIKLAPQRRFIKGVVRLGKVTRRFGKPPIRGPLVKLVRTHRLIPGRVKLYRPLPFQIPPPPPVGGEVRHILVRPPLVHKPFRGQVLTTSHLAYLTVRPPIYPILVKLVTRSRRYAGKGKIKPTSVYGKVVVKPGLLLLRGSLKRLAFQRRKVRGKVTFTKVVRTFNRVLEPKHVTAIIKLAPQRRRVPGSVTLKPFVRTFSAIVEPKRHRLLIKLAPKRRFIRGRVRLSKPVRTFNAIIPPQRHTAPVLQAPQRKFQRGQVTLTAHLASIVINPPIRPITVLLVPKRKTTRGKVQLFKVVRTFTGVKPPHKRLLIDVETTNLYQQVTNTGPFIIKVD